MNKIYAQTIENIVNLIGNQEMGLPLPKNYLEKNSHVLNIDITDIYPKPRLGWYYIDGNFYETDPTPQLIKQTSAELRNRAYQEMLYKEDGTPLIIFEGTIYTCDKAFTQIKIYEEEDKYNVGTEVKGLGQLWLAGKEYIRALYPPENGELFKV